MLFRSVSQSRYVLLVWFSLLFCTDGGPDSEVNEINAVEETSFNQPEPETRIQVEPFDEIIDISEAVGETTGLLSGTAAVGSIVGCFLTSRSNSCKQLSCWRTRACRKSKRSIVGRIHVDRDCVSRYSSHDCRFTLGLVVVVQLNHTKASRNRKFYRLSNNIVVGCDIVTGKRLTQSRST